MDAVSSAAWYAQLAKPFFAPPAWIFGPVWTALYIVIAISFGFVLVQYVKREWPFGVLLPFILNLLFNLAYAPLVGDSTGPATACGTTRSPSWQGCPGGCRHGAVRAH